MGNCAVDYDKHKEKQFKGDYQPLDTESYKDADLPQKLFNVAISNIKLKNLPYQYAELTIQVSSLPEIKLERRKVEEGVAKWNNREERLQLKFNEYQLRKDWITVCLFQSDVKISQVRINMYKIAIGPAHITFPMAISNRRECRLSMDVFITQWARVLIQIVSAEVQLDTPRPQEYFNFTLRAITRSLRDQQQSQPSYPEKTLSVKEGERGRKSYVRQPDPKIVWGSKGNTLLPSVERKVLISNIPSSSLQFMLWECNDLQIQQDDVLTGQCYVPLNKGSRPEPVESSRDSLLTYIYKKVLVEKLWLNGKCVGKVNIQFTFQIDQYIKQNLMYVRTQHGNQMSTPVFDTTKGRVSCPEIAELQKISNIIQEQVHRMNEFKKTQTFKIQDVRNEVLKHMGRMLTLLELSKKESVKSYIYESEKDLLNGQQCLLNIGNKILDRLSDDESQVLKQSCWKCLIALIQRGELSLRYVGFKEEDRVNIVSKSMSKLLKDKFEFSIAYQQFLYDALKCVFISMQSKNLEALERKFVEFFCALSYLRIPEFREELLTAIDKSTDPHIEQWTGPELSLENDADSQLKFLTDPNLSMVYDWQNNFYNVIRHDLRSRQHQAQLKETLKTGQWRQRMEKRGIAFFLFMVYWLEYIQVAAIISVNLKWFMLPGYSRLLKALLCEMERRHLTAWPDSLREVTTKMLANEMLLNVFVSIILKKVNLMEYESVIAGLDLIKGYFKFLASTKRKISTTFNYLNFFNALKCIIEHEHSFSAAVCLKLIYDHYNMFAAEFKRQISQFLLGKAFFKLFLSWSFNIRVVFHHLLLFRLVLQSNRLPSERKDIEHSTNSQIKRRYLLLMTILENVRQRREEDQCDNFRMNYERDYFKKMKKKIHEGRRVTATHKNPVGKALKRKVTLKQNKYSIDQLSRPTETLRAHSEVIESVEVDYMPTRYIQQGTFNAMEFNRDASETQLRLRKKMQTQNQIPEVPFQLLEYSKQSLAEFKNIEDKFNKFYSGKIDYDNVPVLDIKLPTDEGEFSALEKEDW